MVKSKRQKAKSAVITVGEGRGFVVNGRAYFADGPHDRLIITAAHCLPFFPPCSSAAYLEEKTYKSLLGPIGSEPTVWAECLFADPIADIVILGRPDDQVLSDQAAEYEALVESATPLPIADAPEQGHGWLLSLDGKWFRCNLRIISDGPLWISETEEPIEGGMSGSPIISDEAAAMGVVCLADISDVPVGANNPRLVRSLPGWLLLLMRDSS
jgi:hypothetical protein